MIKTESCKNGDDGVVKLPGWAWTVAVLVVSGLVGTAFTGTLAGYHSQHARDIRLENHEGRIARNEAVLQDLLDALKQQGQVVNEIDKKLDRLIGD